MSDSVLKTKNNTKKYNLKGPGPGRPKGCPNKFTTLKQAFLDVFIEMGGSDEMKKVFSKNDFKKADFYKLISKMLPSNVDVDIGIKKGENKLVVEIVDGRKKAPEKKDKEK